MSRIRADKFVNNAANGAPQLTFGAEVVAGVGLTGAGGINITGVATAASFSGNLTGNATGLTGTPNIVVGSVTGTTGSFSGSVSIGGTLTYEDVTNIDSVGIITARAGVNVTGGSVGIGTITPQQKLDVRGNAVIGIDQVSGNPGSNIGIATVRGHHVNSDADYAELYFANSKSSGGSTASIRAGREGDNVGNNLTFYTHPSGGSAGNGFERLSITSAGAAIFKAGLAEKYENAGTTLGSQPNNPLSDGNVILFTGNESGNKTINFTGVHATLSNGETVSFTAILTPNNSGKITVAQVDGQAISIKWSGGSAPSAGASGQDIYTFQILKTGTGVSDYTIFGAAANYA